MVFVFQSINQLTVPTWTDAKWHRVDKAIRLDQVLIDGSFVPSLIDCVNVGLTKMPINKKKKRSKQRAQRKNKRRIATNHFG